MNLSSLEQYILLAVLRLHPNGYGISIQDQIGDKTGKRPSLGSLYAALDRLETKGYITSRQGEPTNERGGKAKLHFTLTGQGQTALAQSLAAVDALRRGLRIREAPA